jgi:uncharacterized membrane protein YjfL (UPF0719 family)
MVSLDVVLTTMVAGFLVGLLQLVVSLFVAMGAVYLGIRSFDKMTVGIEEMKEIKKGNVAVALLMAAVIISIANVIEAGVSSLVKLADPAAGPTIMVVGILVGLAQLIISVVVAMFTINIAIKVLDKITVEIDEMHELKRGNVAVAILMSGVLFAVSFVIKAGITGLTSAISPVSLAGMLVG